MKKKILHRDYNTEKNKQWFLIKLFWPEHGFYNDTFQPWKSKTGVSVVIAKLYALGCICIKGELLSLPKVISCWETIKSAAVSLSLTLSKFLLTH